MYVGRIERLLAYYSPLPMCIVNPQGKVTRASRKIAEVFKYDGIIDYDVFALTGIKMPDFVKAAENGEPLYIQRNDKVFRIGCDFLGTREDEEEGAHEDASIILHFTDITAYEELKERYKDDRVYMMLVNVDNFDEIISGSSDDSDSNVRVSIDKLIRSWAAGMEAMIVRYRENMYELAITHRNYEALVEDKFSILDSARQIESPTDFPVTLSIGLGVGKDSLVKLDDYAQEALDMALGRGGDQAVIKEGRNFEYYGGRTQSVEKSNKGKSRIIGHALATLMEQSSRIFIMGHKNPDMDSFGAAIGISRLARSVGKEAYILLGEYNETMIDMVADAKRTDEYQFVTADDRRELPGRRRGHPQADARRVRRTHRSGGTPRDHRPSQKGGGRLHEPEPFLHGVLCVIRIGTRYGDPSVQAGQEDAYEIRSRCAHGGYHARYKPVRSQSGRQNF